MYKNTVNLISSMYKKKVKLLLVVVGHTIDLEVLGYSVDGVHDFPIDVAIVGFAPVSVDALNVHEGAFDGVFGAVKSHLHHRVEGNLDVGQLLHRQLHQVGVQATHHRLMRHHQQIVAGIQPGQNLAQTPEKKGRQKHVTYCKST